MIKLDGVVAFEGREAALLAITDDRVVIGKPRHFGGSGGRCAITVFAHLTGERVPVPLKGKIQHVTETSLEIEFTAPSKNWLRIATQVCISPVDDLRAATSIS